MKPETWTQLLAGFAAVASMTVLVDAERTERVARDHCAAVRGAYIERAGMCVVDQYVTIVHQERQP